MYGVDVSLEVRGVHPGVETYAGTSLDTIGAPEEVALVEKWAAGMIPQLGRLKDKPYFGIEEYRLANNFASLVEATDLSSLLHLAPGREKPPRNLDEYDLVALQPLQTKYRHSQRSVHGNLDSSKAESKGIEFSYQGTGGKPYLDASFAIGLGYRGILSAVAAAHTDRLGVLRIVQLQSVAPPPDPGEGRDKYSSGLHGGFLWKETMVQAWIELARRLEIPTIEIQGAVNNKYFDQRESYEQYTADWQARFFKSYDDVARRVGFTHNGNTMNWELDLSEELDVPEERPTIWANYR